MHVKFEWRVVSRIVAVGQLIYAAASIFLILYLTALFVTDDIVMECRKDAYFYTIGRALSSGEEATIPHYTEEANVLLWLLLIFAFFASVIELFAGTMLIIETKVGRHPITAQVKARIWQIMNVINVVHHLFLIVALLLADYISAGGYFLVGLLVAGLRLFFVFVVYQFENELKY